MIAVSLGWKGIRQDVLDDAVVEVGADDLVRIPYRRRDGSVHNVRVVAPSGKRWWETSGLEQQIPFGLETLAGTGTTDRALIAAEGESDCLAIREALSDRGYDVLGIPGALSWQRSWRIIVEPYLRIYLLGDGDGAGRRMINQIYRDVPWARPVSLPEGEDARSLLHWWGPYALDPFLEDADAVARLAAAFRIAHDYEEFVELLREEPSHA